MSIKLNLNAKDYLVLGLILLVVILGITATYYYNKAATPAQIANAQKVLANPKADIIKRFTDKNGDNHSEIKADQNKITRAALADTTNKRKRLIDSVKEALNLDNANQIEELTEENFNLKALLKLKAHTDSSGHKTLDYSDPFLTFRFNPDDSTAYLNYRAKILSAMFYRYPIPFLHFFKTPSYIDFYGADKRITIDGVDHMIIQQPDPLFGLTADVKTSYMINSGHLVPSFGAGFRVGKFTFEGREYYSIKNDHFQPAVSASYKFLNQ